MPTITRDWYTRHIRQVGFGGQIWNFEVEVYLPYGQYQIPDSVADVLSYWCSKNCQRYWSRGSNRIYWFQSEEDALLFSMAFSR